VRWRGTAAGGLRPETILRTPARVLVDEALGRFSYAARGVAKRHNLLRLPQTEHQRIGTAPLRRYADLISQRQLVSALRGEPSIPVGEVAALERWMKRKEAEIKKQLQAQQGGVQQVANLRQLEAHCARQASATGSGFAELDATVVRIVRSPRPGPPRVEVKLEAGGMLAHATPSGPSASRRIAEIKPGMRLRVRLRSVDARRGRVEVVLI